MQPSLTGDSFVKKELLTLNINGESRELAVPHHWTLLEVLRYEAGLTGAKQGCDKGDCGACTGLVDGEPILACCTLAVTNQGQSITTIEGLADADGPSVMQRAFDVCGALQCGFCQPVLKKHCCSRSRIVMRFFPAMLLHQKRYRLNW